MPVEIPLTRGYVALVDEADADDLLRFRWRISSGKTRIYAQRTGRRADGSPNSTIYMHRQILCAPDGFDVDHLDNNGLNNQRRNIRIVSRSVNLVRRRRGPNKNGYPGVACVNGRYYGRTTDPATGKDVRTKGFSNPAAAAAALPELLFRIHGALPFTNDERFGPDEIERSFRRAASWRLMP